jgi:hypothetical protein
MQSGVRRQSPVCRTLPKAPSNRNITAPAKFFFLESVVVALMRN